ELLERLQGLGWSNGRNVGALLASPRCSFLRHAAPSHRRLCSGQPNCSPTARRGGPRRGCRCCWVEADNGLLLVEKHLPPTLVQSALKDVKVMTCALSQRREIITIACRHWRLDRNV